MFDIAVYLGIAALILFTYSLLSGLHIIKPKFRLHKKIGIIAYLFIAFHAIVMMYFFFFD